MLRRHEDELRNRIEAVNHKGFAFIEWWELKQWYSMQRLGKSVWRDLRERFDEDEELTGVKVYPTENGVLFIDGNKLESLSEWTSD